MASDIPPQVERRGTQVQLVTKSQKQRRSKRFGEQISNLIRRVNIANVEFLGKHLIPDEVEVDFNVFSAGVKHRIRGKRTRPKIVTPNNRAH